LRTPNSNMENFNDLEMRRAFANAAYPDSQYRGRKTIKKIGVKQSQKSLVTTNPVSFFRAKM